ncbi:GntR family transcriptional regulator [Tamaricihabitans halophyticus]|uniref:GntR family transcriptional regulator n=1 Tax=Tamaricihabitans halophyticus TaxID=1262583 RepID=A0A4R2R4X4_9PSEU|nr:GntR family transcriptional regulator [Tamaricihabitans halophyticus]TCP56839.1 GntR family transcriptional regulator [Tamaricihabitans halophyticus]
MLDELITSAPDFSRQVGAGTPAHVRIEQWLIDAISKGLLAPGDKFPGERDFAARIGVSRMTLRQALNTLEQRGVLTRGTGRSGGAVVVEPKIECDLTGVAGFTEQMRRAHLRAGARLVSARTEPASAQVAEELQITAGDPVHEVVRVRSAERTPLALERSWFSARQLPDLLERRLTGSLYNLLSKQYGLQPHTAVELLEPARASEAEAERLRIEVDDPLMLIQRTAYSSAGLPVEFARDLFRADRIRIMVRSGLQDKSGTSLGVVGTR